MKTLLNKKYFSLLLAVICCLTFFPATSFAAAPPPPKGFKAAALSSSSIKLSWKKVRGAKSYTIYKKSGSKFVRLTTLSSKYYTYTVKKLKANTKYYYKIAVKTSKGTSKLSTQVYAKTKAAAVKPTPPPATVIQQTPPPQGAVTPPPAVSTPFIPTPTPIVPTPTPIIPTPTPIIPTPTPIVPTPTPTTAVQTPPPTPGSSTLGAPSITQCSAISSTEIYMTWTAVAGANKYMVYISDNASTGFVFAFYWTAAYVYVQDLDPNTMYYFKVCAVDSNGNAGALSTAKGAKTLAAPVIQGTPNYDFYDWQQSASNPNNIKIWFERIYDSPNATAYSQYYSLNGGPWVKEDDKLAPIDSKFFYIEAPKGSTLRTRFTYNIGASESQPQEFGPYAALGRPAAMSGNLYGLVKSFNVDLGAGKGGFSAVWNAVPGAEKYDVYMNSISAIWQYYKVTTFNGTPTQLNPLTYTYDTLNHPNITKPTNLQYPANYFIRVRAVNNVGVPSPFISLVIQVPMDCMNNWHYN